MAAKLAVLLSGNGSNLQALLDACESQHLPASIVVVISNKADAFGLTRARNSNVPAVHLGLLAGEARRAYDLRLAAQVQVFQPDYVILAGWMRLLTSSFLDQFPKRVINLHPALPGMFPGTHAIQRAYAAYQNGEITHSGVMVHLVPDEGVDSGPVLATWKVYFRPDETLAEFETRMHSAEHFLLVQALKQQIIGINNG